MFSHLGVFKNIPLSVCSSQFLQTNTPEDLHSQRWILSCYFHDGINCANNWFVNEILLIREKKVYQGLNGSSISFSPSQAFQECAIVKPRRSICAKVNFYSLSSRSRVLLGLNTWKMHSSTNTGLARGSCVQLNILINTQDVSENECPWSNERK